MGGRQARDEEKAVEEDAVVEKEKESTRGGMGRARTTKAKAKTKVERKEAKVTSVGRTAEESSSIPNADTAVGGIIMRRTATGGPRKMESMQTEWQEGNSNRTTTIISSSNSNSPT